MTSQVKPGPLARASQQASFYNLTVDDLHTHYVLAGPTSLLVHNCGVGSRQSGGCRTPPWGKYVGAAAGLPPLSRFEVGGVDPLVELGDPEGVAIGGGDAAGFGPGGSVGVEGEVDDLFVASALISAVTLHGLLSPVSGSVAMAVSPMTTSLMGLRVPSAISTGVSPVKLFGSAQLPSLGPSLPSSMAPKPSPSMPDRKPMAAYRPGPS